MSKQQAYEAIVVGSGISGGWAAKELTERGLRTLVLEAGGTVTPERLHHDPLPRGTSNIEGVVTVRGSPESAPSRAPATPALLGASSSSSAMTRTPTARGTAPISPGSEGRQVGGRSLVWARHVYRWSDLDFEANANDGHGVDWPIRYADVEPWYDHVERFIGVSGRAEGLAQLPDAQFLPPHAAELYGAVGPGQADRRVRRRSADHLRAVCCAHPGTQRACRVPLLWYLRAGLYDALPTSARRPPRCPQRSRRDDSRCGP